MLPFARVAVLGLGLIGSSVARGVRAAMPSVALSGYDADPAVRNTARAIDLVDDVADTAGAAVIDADLVVLCVPVGAMGALAADFADDLPADGQGLGDLAVDEIDGAVACVTAIADSRGSALDFDRIEQ